PPTRGMAQPRVPTSNSIAALHDKPRMFTPKLDCCSRSWIGGLRPVQPPAKSTPFFHCKFRARSSWRRGGGPSGAPEIRERPILYPRFRSPDPRPHMLARIRSAAVLGIDAYPVEVEVDISNGLPSFSTVGLPHGAVREGRER